MTSKDVDNRPGIGVDEAWEFVYNSENRQMEVIRDTATVGLWTYNAFGNTVKKVAGTITEELYFDGAATPGSLTCYVTPTENVKNRDTYTGREWDGESQTYYYRTRHVRGQDLPGAWRPGDAGDFRPGWRALRCSRTRTGRPPQEPLGVREACEVRRAFPRLCRIGRHGCSPVWHWIQDKVPVLFRIRLPDIRRSSVELAAQGTLIAASTLAVLKTMFAVPTVTVMSSAVTCADACGTDETEESVAVSTCRK